MNLFLENINIMICFCLLVMGFLILKLRKSILEEQKYYKKRNNEIKETEALAEKQTLGSEIISLKNQIKQLESENTFLKNLLLKEKKENSPISIKLLQNVQQNSNSKDEQESRLRAEIIELENRTNNIAKERDFLLKHIEDEKKVSKKNPFFAISDK
jgi:hypothetical protein